jgi:hypothetical protein
MVVLKPTMQNSERLTVLNLIVLLASQIYNL